MKYSRAARFIADLRRLTPAERKLFREVVVEQFVPAADRIAAVPGEPWPKGLRVKRVRGAPGVWEMTWSFSGPDGRATFEWIEIDDEPAILWRRVGGHAIFPEP
ncbi:MAG: hypothetical protein ACR2GL_01420 [Thermoleophilaceae bacterium]